MKTIKRVSVSCLFVLFFVLVSGVSAQAMMIAVPAVAPEKNAPISEETGRAPFFLIFDEKGQFVEAIENPAITQSGGISRTVVALLVDMDINMVVASSIGDKMKSALTNKQIEIRIKTGMADEAVKAVIQK